MSDEILGQGRFLRLVKKEGHWEYVERVNAAGVVAMVAVTDDGEILLVEQDRPALGRRVIEIPAGLAGDVAGEDSLLEAAARELMEETGFCAERWERLADAPPSAGLTNEVITFYRAFGVHRVAEGGGDEHEDIKVHLVPLDGVRPWLRERIAEGAMVDMKLLAGLYFASLQD